MKGCVETMVSRVFDIEEHDIEEASKRLSRAFETFDISELLKGLDELSEYGCPLDADSIRKYSATLLI